MAFLVPVLVLVLVAADAARAQTARDGRLMVTVSDQTGAVIQDATVTATAQDNPERAVAVAPAQSSVQGIATLQGLTPGRYTVVIEFPGFETTVLRDVRIRTGDNRQNAVLNIQKLEDTVTVGQDPDRAAADPRGPAFGTVLTREQIDALSDDPEELKRQLQDMAGPGATIKIDSFEGGQLPPKSQIRMIRFSRDTFAAEHHSAGGLQIDIITQPGIGPLRANLNMRLRDGALTGRSPFVQEKGPERTQEYGINIGGSLARDRTSFNLNLSGMDSFDTPNLNAALLSGTRSEALALRRPRDQMAVNVNLDHALTKDQTLRFNVFRNASSNRNLGVGDYNLPERAYENEFWNAGVRAQHVGPLGRRFFTNSRVQLTWNESAFRSALEAPTIRVIDAFTSGGQQLAGGSHNRFLNVASDLDYVRGIHSLRTGIIVDGQWSHSDSTSNYLGTYTFESLTAYEQGLPRSYTRRIGDPNIDFVNLQGGFYIQDDIRVRRNLTLSPGVRYEMQTHVSDFNNIGPRFGVTWSPGTSGRTSFRLSSGIFYDWLGLSTYEQTLRVDGFRQQELNIAEPLYPDPGGVEVVPPVNRYLLSQGVRMPRQVRFSGGVDRSLTRQSRIGLTWAHMRGSSLQRGENRNGPVNGVRPFPEFGNVIEVVSDARSRQDTLTLFFNMSLNRPPPTPPGQPAPGAGAAPLPFAVGLPLARTQPLFDWRRASINGQYTAGWLRNNTDGDFTVAPTGTLESEWGTANGDVRHRVFVQFSSQALKNLTTSIVLNALSGTPYTLQTGLDDNGDLIFNDRPEGVKRNTERATRQMFLNANVNYSFTFGRANTNTPPPTAIGITNVGGVVSAQTIAVPQTGKYRISIFANAQNLTNRANYVGYSGVRTSPFFRQPRDVSNPRRVDVGVNFGF
jgi:hypothetical protein